jgi:hypothetical protein
MNSKSAVSVKTLKYARSELGLALVAIFVLTAVGKLLDWVEVKNVFVALGLVAALVVAAVVADVIVRDRFLSSVAEHDRQSRDVVHQLVLKFGLTSSVRSGSMDETAVILLESSAERVWVYAYDLAYELKENAFTEVVKANLKRGVEYKYVIPNDPRVIDKLPYILDQYKEIDKYEELIKFFVRPSTDNFVQFGITIYNPSLKKPEGSTAVFFPHYSDDAEASFPVLSGAKTYGILEGFIQLIKVPPLSVSV